MLIKNAVIFTALQPEPIQADISMANGTIRAIAPGLSPAPGQEVVDAAGMRIYPGFVDAHSHLALDGYGMGYDSIDYNEMGNIISPQLRGIDSFNPQDRSIEMARRGGVTTVGVGPGSANVLGGTFFAVKTYGSCVDDMILRDPVAMKCAFGENPKRCYKDKGNSARMSTAAKLRETLFAARDYMKRKEAAGDDVQKQPKFDLKMEALIPVLQGEILLKAHAHRADDIVTAVRLSREFGLDCAIVHGTEGHLIADLLAKEGIPVITGPFLTDRGKPELAKLTMENTAILARAGVQTAICTDHPETPIALLPFCAAMAARAGMDEEEALAAITINAACICGAGDRLGSLSPGKDADLVVMDGHPFHWRTRVTHVLIDGQEVI